MADVRSIRVSATRSSVLANFIRQASFWAFLVLSIGISKVWFGGSWVIDVMALMLTIFGTFAVGARLAGRDAELTKPQIAAWVAAGQPDDVKAWKERTYG